MHQGGVRFSRCLRGVCAPGAAVIGISADSLERHRDFAAGRQLPYLLLSDHDGSLRELYQVPKTLGILPRVTYVINKRHRAARLQCPFCGRAASGGSVGGGAEPGGERGKGRRGGGFVNRASDCS